MSTVEAAGIDARMVKIAGLSIQVVSEIDGA